MFILKLIEVMKIFFMVLILGKFFRGFLQMSGSCL